MVLKVGQKVTVRSDLMGGKDYNGAHVTSLMLCLKGKQDEITHVDTDGDMLFYKINHQSVNDCWWTEEMFIVEPLSADEAFDLLVEGTWSESEYEHWLLYDKNNT